MFPFPTKGNDGEVLTWYLGRWQPRPAPAGGGSYTLPTASAGTLGGVKVGTGLSIDGSGVLSASGGGGGGTWSHPTGNPVTLANGAEVTVTHPSVTDNKILAVIYETWTPAGAEYPTIALTDYTSSGYTVSASSEATPVGYYRAWKAFNDVVTGDQERWISAGGYTQWLRIDMPVSIVVASYTIDPYYMPSAPKAWTLSGSNDGSSWTVIDTRTAQTGWTVARTFTLSSTPASYTKFKFDFTDSNGSSGAETYSVAEVYFNATASETTELCTIGNYTSSQQFGMKRLTATTTSFKNLSGSSKTVHIGVLT